MTKTENPRSTEATPPDYPVSEQNLQVSEEPSCAMMFGGFMIGLLIGGVGIPYLLFQWLMWALESKSGCSCIGCGALPFLFAPFGAAIGASIGMALTSFSVRRKSTGIRNGKAHLPGSDAL